MDNVVKFLHLVVTIEEKKGVKMGKRRGGDAILKNILNLSGRSREGGGKEGKGTSLWCPLPLRKKEKEDFYYNRGEKTNSTPPVSENPISFEKKQEDELAHVEDLAEKECGGKEGGIWATVEESSNRIIDLSKELTSSELLINLESKKMGLGSKQKEEKVEDWELANKTEQCSQTGEESHTTNIPKVQLEADENEDQNYETYGHIADPIYSFVGAGNFERCDQLCDSELAEALRSFSTLSLGLSLDTLASRRERLAARSSDLLRAPQRLTTVSSEVLQRSLPRRQKSSLQSGEMRSSLPMLPRSNSTERLKGIN